MYRQRAILAEGKPVVTDKMDFDQFQEKYFRFWNVEDSPADNTFDKYQKAYFQEKTFDVEVTDGQLNVDFQGENWGCCVSAVVVFPVAKAAEGEAFLEVRRSEDAGSTSTTTSSASCTARRATRCSPTAEDQRRGYVVFQRDYMQDVYYNDTPRDGGDRRPAARRGVCRRAGAADAGRRAAAATWAE